MKFFAEPVRELHSTIAAIKGSAFANSSSASAIVPVQGDQLLDRFALLDDVM